MDTEREDRLVAAWERLATALEGIHEAARSAISKHWPEPVQREVVVTRVESQEERAKKEQGKLVPQGGITDWLSESFTDDDEYVGPREREWRDRQKQKQRDQDADSHPDGFSGPEDGGVKETESNAAGTGDSTTDKQDTQES